MSRSSPARARAALDHAAAMLVAMSLSVGSNNPGWLAALGVSSLGRWIYVHRQDGEVVPISGANAITALRVVLVASLGLLAPDQMIPTAGLVLLTVFVLDGLDGWWARRTNTDCPFGAAFDQEADAMMVAMGSTCAAMAGVAPRWVLAAGALRYGYVLVVHTLELRGEAPRSTIARYVFAAVVVSMVAALTWPHPMTSAALAGATVLLGWSFGRSLWWSWRGPRGG